MKLLKLPDLVIGQILEILALHFEHLSRFLALVVDQSRQIDSLNLPNVAHAVGELDLVATIPQVEPGGQGQEQVEVRNLESVEGRDVVHGVFSVFLAHDPLAVLVDDGIRSLLPLVHRQRHSHVDWQLVLRTCSYSWLLLP